MRKLSLLLLAVLTIVSCSDETGVLSNSDSDLESLGQRMANRSIYVKDGHMVFDCEQTLESYIHGLSEKGTDPRVIGKQFGFNSYLNTVKPSKENEDIFGDEYFAGVLNQDGVLAVGDYVFKLNPSSRQAFAVPLSSAGEYTQALVQANSESQLPRSSMAFSFDDDVFDLLSDRTSCIKEEKCNEDCAPRDDDTKNALYCFTFADFAYRIHVKYGRIALWHYINTKLEHNYYNSSFNIQNPGNMDIRYSAKWKRRCRDEGKSNRDYVCDFVPTGADEDCFPLDGSKVYKKRFYSGTRCLSKYHLKADARIQYGCNPNLMIWTNFVEIKSGY